MKWIDVQKEVVGLLMAQCIKLLIILASRSDFSLCNMHNLEGNYWFHIVAVEFSVIFCDVCVYTDTTYTYTPYNNEENIFKGNSKKVTEHKI